MYIFGKEQYLKSLLSKWNSDLLKDWKKHLEEYGEEEDEAKAAPYLQKGWVGEKPASEEAIAELERRIGILLPDSYRFFLAATNGWAYLGGEYDFPGPIRNVNQVCWFRDEDQDWIDAYQDPSLSELSKKDHLCYGSKQDTVYFRSSYLDDCLKISDTSEGGVILLNPSVQTKDCEWEAWHFANHFPGAARYKTFLELLEDLYSLNKRLMRRYS